MRGFFRGFLLRNAGGKRALSAEISRKKHGKSRSGQGKNAPEGIKIARHEPGVFFKALKARHLQFEGTKVLKC
jgi:hypothetical protein